MRGELVSVRQESAINSVIRRRALRGAIAATTCTVVLAASLAACGNLKQLSAADKVSNAFDKLGAGKSFKAELSVAATPDQLIAFGKAIGDPIERRDAEALSGVTLSVAARADKPLKDLGRDSHRSATEADFSYALTKGGTGYLDLRAIKGKVYLKVDAEGLVKLGGDDPAQVREVADSMPPEMNVVKDVLAGKWIALDTQLLTELGKDPGFLGKSGVPKPFRSSAASAAPSAAPSGLPTLDAATARKLGDAIKDVFSKNLTFEDKGKQDGADHIVISAPARGLTDGLLKAFKQTLAKDLPGVDTLPTDVPSGVPNRSIALDVLVKDGALSSMTLDIAQLNEKAGPDVHFPITLKFSQDAPALVAPTGAVEVTKADLDRTMKAMADAEAADAAGGGPGGHPAAPLTDTELRDLVKSGLPADVAKNMNKSGLSYRDIKQIISQQG